MPRQVMQLARKSVQVQPVRGKAVSNWKRPTMDEYLAPHEAYGPANAKRQKSYNMFFLGKPHNNCLLITTPVLAHLYKYPASNGSKG